MKQIDRLLEQKDVLLRKKEAIEFQSKEVLDKHEIELEKNINHYSLLRSAWTKLPKQESDCYEKIDSISKVVNMVRNNLKNIIREENLNIEEEVNNYQAEMSSKELKLRQKEREKVERLSMENQ